MRMINDENGFTVLELLASLIIISLIVLMLGSFLKIGMRGYEGGISFTEMQENGRQSVQMLTSDIKKCQEIVAADNNSLMLRTLNGDEIRYYTNSKVLYRSINGTSNPAAMGIVDFRVREIFPDEIEITLQASDGRKAYDLVTRVTKL